MKKTVKLTALVMALMMILCSCGSKKGSAEFDYSKGLDDNGFYTGIKASDYVTLCDFGTITVSDDEVNEEISYLMSQTEYMKQIPNTVDPIEMYDEVNIDYVGSIDGVEFEGGNTQGLGTTVQIGVTSYIDNFLDQLIGHRPGEVVDVHVTFPQDYGNADLAGKPALFVVQIHYTIDYEKYEISDEFVKEKLNADYGWETVADMKQGIRGYFVEDKAMNGSTFKDELPEIIKTQYVDRMVFELKTTASYYNMTADDYISAMYSAYGIATLDQYKEIISENADTAAKNYLFYQAVAEKYNISVTEDDITAYYEKNDMTEDKKEAVSFYGKPFITAMVLYDKVVDYLYHL